MARSPAWTAAGRRKGAGMPKRRKGAAVCADLRTELAVLEERLRITTKDQRRALKIQAKEYKRRLEVLNSNHEERVKDQGDHVRLEVFNRSESEHRSASRTVNDLALKLEARVTSNEKDLQRVTSSITWLSRLLIATALAGVIELAVGYFVHLR